MTANARAVAVALLSCLTLTATLEAASAGEEDDLVASFKKLVEQVQEAAHLSPYVARFETFSSSEKTTYGVQELIADGVAFDVKKTDSLVTPYLGSINFDLLWSYHSTCDAATRAAMKLPFEVQLRQGVKINCPPKAATSEQAVGQEINEHDSPRLVRLLYAFQNGKWVLKVAKIGVKQSNGAVTFAQHTTRDADDAQDAPVFKRFLSRLYRLTLVETESSRNQ